MANIAVLHGARAAQDWGLSNSCEVIDASEPWVAERWTTLEIHAMGPLPLMCIRVAHSPVCLWTLQKYKTDGLSACERWRTERRCAKTPPLPQALPAPKADEPTAQTTELPTAPPTLQPKELGPLSKRIEEINKLARQSLPITRHCGTDAVCRKEQTAAMYSIAAREIANAKALRNPTMYANAALDNDILNSCIVMWGASEDFAATMQCINDAAPTM
jgi:hypothetical protein